MNCPRCGRELVEVEGGASCAPCNITIGVHKAVQPEPVKEVVPEEVASEEPTEVNPEDVEESAEAEGFPQEDNQESEEEAKE